jgi:ankyrin repeat protein
MLDAGWPPDARDAQGTTALHWAAFHGNLEMARALLARGARADVSEREHGGTPIDWAEHGAVHGWYRRTGDYPGVLAALRG